MTLRFPDRLHARAKIEATKRGVTLQEFVGQAVEAHMRRGADRPPPPIVASIATRVAGLPARSQKIVERFVAMIAVAPDFYLRPIELYVTGMLAVFRRIGKNQFKGDGALS
jgi:hypothetical protein